MLAPDNEKRPQVESAGAEYATVGGMQLHGGGAAQALAAVVSDLPCPPYPSTTKAGGFRFELDIERMRQSDTWAIAEAHQRPFLVMVWIESWTQVPAGSLPDSDAVIAARIGMSLPEFKAGKEVLMRGWWKASDGRLYHPVITEQVFGMVSRKSRKAANQAAYRDRQQRKDEGHAEVADHPPATDHEVTGHPVVTDCTTTNTTNNTNTKEQKQKQKHLPGPEGPSRTLHESEVGITIPLKGGGEYVVTGAEVAELTSAHPGKDVIGKLREARAWCVLNPAKRKTRSDVGKFLYGWVGREFANAPPGRRNNTDSYFEGVSEKFENYNGPTVSLL
jgi:hypothetical protein